MYLSKSLQKTKKKKQLLDLRKITVIKEFKTLKRESLLIKKKIHNMKRVSNTHNEKYKEQRRIEFRESSLDKGTQNIKREMVCEYTEKKTV